jgi:mono/diheme cytochrome c family protein
MRYLFMSLAAAVLALGIASAADTAAGKAVYDRACKSCHGADGVPNPAIEKALKITIGDLKSAEVQSMSDGDMKKIVTEGKGKMHAVTTVSGKQVDDVVAYVKSLK